MSTYVYPEMPLELPVWYVHGESAPIEPPNDFVTCSLSPVRPEDFYKSTSPAASYPSTHIIRCPPGLPISDNYVPRTANNPFPCTIWEYPPGSKHWYVTVWSHEVGAGFPNHHGRVYVTRWRFDPVEGVPVFQGYV